MPEPAPVDSVIAVSVKIDSSYAKNRSFGTISKTVEIGTGDTVYDALKACDVSIGGSGSYISSINGLKEKAVGSMSGWTYYVNGSFPTKPANQYVLHDGDSVLWLYITSPEDKL